MSPHPVGCRLPCLLCIVSWFHSVRLFCRIGIGWRTRADGNGIIGRSPILAHSGEMVRLALRGSGADRLPASAMDTSQDLLIKRPIVDLFTVILRFCAATITMIVR